MASKLFCQEGNVSVLSDETPCNLVERYQQPVDPSLGTPCWEFISETFTMLTLLSESASIYNLWL
jgi:hypothetical protein